MGTVTLIHDVDIERRTAASRITVGGDFRDACIDDGQPDSNTDESTIFAGTYEEGAKGEPGQEWKALIYYDLNNFIPASATITVAVWHPKMYIADNDVDHTYRIIRCLRDWIEDEVTWNSWKTGSAWTTAGAEGEGTDRDSADYVALGAITTTGWKTYTVTAFVQDIWNNHGGICNFILERDDAVQNEQGVVHIFAKNFAAADSGRDEPHHLRITYTLADKTFQAIVR